MRLLSFRVGFLQFLRSTKNAFILAVAFENLGSFIETDLAPRRIPQGRNYSGQMT